MIILLTIIVFSIDIISKVIVNRYIDLGDSIRLIGEYCYLTNVRNTGVAWSMFDNNSFLVLFISFMIIIGLTIYIIKNKPNMIIEKIAYAFILGGAIGNFINRCINGYVIDFIGIKILDYNYPIFNLADSFIVIGVILLIIYTWRCNNGNKSR